jgi:hypothetical protein
LPVYGAALEFLQKRFGGLFREVTTQVVTSIVRAQIVEPSGERVSLTIVNLGGSEVFIDPTSGVSSTRGIRISPNGGLFSVNVDQDALLPTLQWFGVATAGNPEVYILEIRRDTAT